MLWLAIGLSIGANSARAASVSFQRLVSAVGAFPEGEATADFNGDGRQDLAVANYNSGNVSVLLGTGSGTFTAAPGSPISVTYGPGSVTVGDFNGDGRKDLAVASSGSNVVTILLGNGDGTFTQASGSPITVGLGPRGVAVGDFNGDGIQDLAIANADANTVSILLGKGNGTFTAASGSPITVGTTPWGVAVGDFNGDGIQDLAVTNSDTSSNSVSILLGNGDGTFTPASGSPITVGTAPTGVVVEDFNGDGIQDLAIANDEAGSVSILLGNGDGTFTQASGSPVSVGSGPMSLAVGDFNGDGIPDLGVSDEYLTNTVSILLGNGNGTFTAPSNSPITVGNNPYGIVAGDFDGDGREDLATDNAGSGSVTVLLNTGQPAVGVSPASLAFTPAQVGSVSGSQALTITNTGAQPLYVYGATVVGQDANAFKLSGDACSNTTIEAGTSCTIGIQFSPVASGPASAQLRIASSVPGGYSLASLSGAGLPLPLAGLSFATLPGPLFGTGSNAYGQLGIGGTASASSPVQMQQPLRFVAASAGGYHSLGLLADGTVWAWGENNYGQLGNGSSVDSHSPVEVAAPSGMVAVSAGLYHSLALRSDGTVWAWGENAYGQLGNGNTTTSDLPVQVSGLSNVVAIAAGGYYGLALRSDGTVWAWGIDNYGQLGNAQSGGSSSTPVQVKNLSGIVAIAAGQTHSLALRSDGTAWAWGYNGYGELGNGNTTNSSIPVKVSGLSNVVAIAAGGYHSLAILSGGAVQSWGDNSNGQLGNNSTTKSDVPVAVSGLSGATQISAGMYHSVALDGSGRVWAWGDNASGQLGTGNTTDRHTPAQISALGHGGEAVSGGSVGSQTLVIGQPYISLSATTLTFGSEPVGTASSSQSETVTNNGAVPLQISQDTIIGSDGDEFTITGDGCAGVTIASGRSCTIGVRFDPKASGTPVANLRIESNSPTSPDVVTLDPPPPPNPTTLATSPHLGTAAVSCAALRVRHGTLTVRCKLASTIAAGKHRVKLRLLHGARALVTTTAHTNNRTFTVHFKLRHGLKAGTYTLSITISPSTAQTNQAIRLHTIPKTGRPRPG